MSHHTHGRSIEILLVEDNPGDVRLTIEAFKEGKVRNSLAIARDGAEGLALVELRNPEGGGLTLWADESYGYLQLFTGDPLPDVSRRSLAVEPMTCPPNAFRTGEALIRLEPGETHTSAWGIAPSTASSSAL